jgi:hypothetical protein
MQAEIADQWLDAWAIEATGRHRGIVWPWPW